MDNLTNSSPVMSIVVAIDTTTVNNFFEMINLTKKSCKVNCCVLKGRLVVAVTNHMA